MIAKIENKYLRRSAIIVTMVPVAVAHVLWESAKASVEAAKGLVATVKGVW